MDKYLYWLVNKVYPILGKISVDKYIHFIICMFLCSIITGLLETVLPTLFAIILASIITILLTYWKEYRDMKHIGVFDNKDMKAGILGVLASVIMSIIS